MNYRPHKRLSGTQRIALFVLHCIESKGRFEPVPSARLRDVVNRWRADNNKDPVAYSNFHVSCMGLVDKGLLARSELAIGIQVAYQLTETGRSKAAEVAESMTTS